MEKILTLIHGPIVFPLTFIQIYNFNREIFLILWLPELCCEIMLSLNTKIGYIR